MIPGSSAKAGRNTDGEFALGLDFTLTEGRVSLVHLEGRVTSAIKVYTLMASYLKVHLLKILIRCV